MNLEERNKGWTTAAELYFIDQIASKAHTIDSIMLLRGYLAGMTKRVDFCAMNATEVTGYAQARLKLLELKLAA